jgi:hypothetical protein
MFYRLSRRVARGKLAILQVGPSKIRVVGAHVFQQTKVMTRPEGKKNLQVDLPETLHDELIAWISAHKDVKIRQCVQAMIELWMVLPEQLQAMLLLCERGSNTFVRAAEIAAEAIAGAIRSEEPEPAEAAILKLKDIAGRVEPGTIKLLSPAEQELVDGLRKLLGPGGTAEKRAARAAAGLPTSSRADRRKAGS